LLDLFLKNKKKYIALQAADFLAYYSRRIRNKNFASANAQADMRFFEMATEAISHSQFLATVSVLSQYDLRQDHGRSDDPKRKTADYKESVY
jgi:hypothetical protein